jgi:hypothetical protein
MEVKLTIKCDIADAQEILYEAAKIIDKRAKPKEDYNAEID